MPYKEVKIAVDHEVRALCIRSYPNHKTGCPNYSKRITCPPDCPTVEKLIDLSSPAYIIWNKFDFGSHCKRMQRKHPEWTERQIKCCLYWQPKARKQLRNEIKEFINNIPEMRIVKNPEAAGINVTETMRRAGIKLEWPPRFVTYQVMVAGKRKC